MGGEECPDDLGDDAWSRTEERGEANMPKARIATEPSQDQCRPVTSLKHNRTRVEDRQGYGLRYSGSESIHPMNHRGQDWGGMVRGQLGHSSRITKG